ncbi:MAG: hypothetical protein AB7I50_18490 [Vicinamibacterales bacterium]
MSRLLLFVYLLETGLLLVVVPWSVFWERNLFVDQLPLVRELFLNLFTRGGISGVGLVCLGGAVVELRTLWRRRSTASTPARQVDESGTPG